MAECNGCGRCCSLGGRCELREWVGLTPGFVGRCEQLMDNDDGTTWCQVLDDEPNEVLELVVDGQCDFPVLKKERPTMPNIGDPCPDGPSVREWIATQDENNELLWHVTLIYG